MVVFNAIAFTLFCAYLPRILYALPGDRVTLVDFGFGAGLNNEDGDSLVTQFLIPSGTPRGGDQTTFEYVEIEFTTTDSGATVPQTTFTGKLVASASGWEIDATYTPAVSGKPTAVTVVEACRATAANGGECSAVLNHETIFTTEVPITQFLAVTSSSTLSTTSPATSSKSTTSRATISATVAVSAGSHRKPLVRAVIVGTIVGVLVVCVLVAGLFTLRRRRQRLGKIVNIDSYRETPSRQQDTLLPVSRSHLDPLPTETLSSSQHSLEPDIRVEGTVDSKHNVVLRWEEHTDDAREELQPTQTSLNTWTEDNHNPETNGVAMQQSMTEILERLKRLEEQGLPPPNYVS